MRSTLPENTRFVERGKKGCVVRWGPGLPAPRTVGTRVACWHLAGRSHAPRLFDKGGGPRPPSPIPALPASPLGQHWDLQPLRPDGRARSPERRKLLAPFYLLLRLYTMTKPHTEMSPGSFPVRAQLGTPPSSPPSTSKELFKARFCPDDFTSFSLLPSPSEHHL